MSDELQAMAFFAGANSIFYGECLLTTPNPETHRDLQLFKRLGIRPEQRIEPSDAEQEQKLAAELQAQQDAERFVDVTFSH
jgi:biotin synthase